MAWTGIIFITWRHTIWGIHCCIAGWRRCWFGWYMFIGLSCWNYVLVRRCWFVISHNYCFNIVPYLTKKWHQLPQFVFLKKRIKFCSIWQYHDKATNLIKLSHFSIGVFILKRWWRCWSYAHTKSFNKCDSKKNSEHSKIYFFDCLNFDPSATPEWECVMHFG